MARIKDLLYEDIAKDTYCGLVKGVFENDNEIIEELNAKSMPELFRCNKG